MNSSRRIHCLYLVIGVLVAWVTAVIPASAQDAITVALTSSQDTITVGDRLHLILEVTHPPGYRLAPLSLAQTWGDFEVLAQHNAQIAQGEGTVTTTQEIEVTLWAPGEYQTPPLPVTLLTPSGEEVVRTAVPLTITVNSVLTDDDRALRDIAGQASLPVAATRWPWWALVLLAIGGGTAVFWLYRRRKITLAAPVADEAADVLAELDRIERLALYRQGHLKNHYHLLSDALRRAVAQAYAIPANRQTTPEVAAHLAQHDRPLCPEDQSGLVGLLQTADAVRFGSGRATPETAVAELAEARRLACLLQNGHDGKENGRTP